MGRGTGVEVRPGRGLLREVGREPLVEEDDGDVEQLPQPRRELLARPRLLAALAAQRQREADHDLSDVLGCNQPLQLGETGVRLRTLDDAERPRDRAGRVRHRDAGPRGPEVERHDLHAVTSSFAASRAALTPSGLLPPASASVGLPPPPPPMCFPSSRTNATASSPRSTSDWSKLTTRNARPSSTDATITPSAFSCCRTRSRRPRNGPPFTPFASTRTTSPARPCTTKSISAFSFGFALRACSSSWRKWSASRACSRRYANASPAVTASIRRAPAPTELSAVITNGPTSAVEPTCVPPQSSRDQPSTSTRRTTSPYFSPKSIIAPSFRASSIVVS